MQGVGRGEADLLLGMAAGVGAGRGARGRWAQAAGLTRQPARRASQTGRSSSSSRTQARRRVRLSRSRTLARAQASSAWAMRPSVVAASASACAWSARISGWSASLLPAGLLERPAAGEQPDALVGAARRRWPGPGRPCADRAAAPGCAPATRLPRSGRRRGGADRAAAAPALGPVRGLRRRTGPGSRGDSLTSWNSSGKLTRCLIPRRREGAGASLSST